MSLDSTRTAISSGQSAAKLSEWRPNVTPHVERSLLAILERFGVPLYVPDCDTPQPWWPLTERRNQDL